MADDNVLIKPDMKLRTCPSKQVGGWIPSPLSERLEALVALADEEGAATNRTELLAALILAASESAADLADLVTTYRKARASDAALKMGEAGDVLVFRRYRPGRRRRAEGAVG